MENKCSTQKKDKENLTIVNKILRRQLGKAGAMRLKKQNEVKIIATTIP